MSKRKLVSLKVNITTEKSFKEFSETDLKVIFDEDHYYGSFTILWNGVHIEYLRDLLRCKRNAIRVIKTGGDERFGEEPEYTLECESTIVKHGEPVSKMTMKHKNLVYPYWDFFRDTIQKFIWNYEETNVNFIVNTTSHKMMMNSIVGFTNYVSPYYNLPRKRPSGYKNVEVKDEPENNDVVTESAKDNKSEEVTTNIKDGGVDCALHVLEKKSYCPSESFTPEEDVESKDIVLKLIGSISTKEAAENAHFTTGEKSKLLDLLVDMHDSNSDSEACNVVNIKVSTIDDLLKRVINDVTMDKPISLSLVEKVTLLNSLTDYAVAKYNKPMVTAVQKNDSKAPSDD